ncbi:MAG: hypothetical protein KDA61_12400 [Planctomycetales bacterium]|nr:hypothetical protein [Planctomycetales bacterium]
MTKKPRDLEQEALEAVANRLVGREIASVIYFPEEEAAEYDWCFRPIVLELGDGSHIFPMSDAEGNDGGTLATGYEDMPLISARWSQPSS